MIQSMTAFGRAQSDSEWGSLSCELRSINHRYLEISLRTPETLNSLEADIRDLIRQSIKRGKLDCTIRFQDKAMTHAELNLNMQAVQQLQLALQQLQSQVPTLAAVSPIDILRWPGVMQSAQVDDTAMKALVLKTLSAAIEQLQAARRREGQQLKTFFIEQTQLMTKEIDKVRQRISEIMKKQNQKLLNRLQEAKQQLDPMRLEQELVLVAQRIDVTEEVERLQNHLIEVVRVVKAGGNMGRRLDFMMQELNREANTLGSKSVDIETTQIAIELKVLIEQMREQVQNIE